MTAGKKPILFRAIHTKTRWRKARHETLANARSVGERSGRALFRGENRVIDLAKHGQPLYVVIWAEGAMAGEILKPSAHGYQAEVVALKDILRWEKAGGADNEEFERYFSQAAVVERSPPPDAPLHEVALALAGSAEDAEEESPTDTDAQASSADEAFAEGHIVIEAHVRRERDPRVRDRLLADRRNRAALVCEMCGRQAAGTDSRLSEAIFEAHHLVPLAAGLDRETKLTDMALLCACCHRLIHRAIEVDGTWLSIEQATMLVSKITGTSRHTQMI